MKLNEKLDLAIKIIATIVAALWALMNYVRGRTHQPRLRLRVSADRIPLDGLEYLIVKAELENVGQARVKIKREGSHVTIFSDDTPQGVPFAWGSGWNQIEDRFSLLEDQQWVEPSSLVNDQILIAVPGLDTRFIRVLAHAESEEVAWNASTIVGRVGFAVPR